MTEGGLGDHPDEPIITIHIHIEYAIKCGSTLTGSINQEKITKTIAIINENAIFDIDVLK